MIARDSQRQYFIGGPLPASSLQTLAFEFIDLFDDDDCAAIDLLRTSVWLRLLSGKFRRRKHYDQSHNKCCFQL